MHIYIDRQALHIHAYSTCQRRRQFRSAFLISSLHSLHFVIFLILIFMPPINLNKQRSSSTQTLTSPQEARLLVRETLRISASLASAPDNSAAAFHSAQVAEENRALLKHGGSAFGLLDEQFVNSSLRLICCEEVDGRRWNYVADNDASGRFKKGSLRAISLQTPKSPADELMAFVRSYVVPEGFPHSVDPAYAPYMYWRALKYFFGGAMGVFTTQSLLKSVGASKNRAASGAVAINWILKDGAGRVGKMIFARQGKKFDYDLKQLRFSGDVLMEIGAGLELATSVLPQFFLPLACAANVAKNVGAVTSTSTRTPIYKAFARGENIGDITAKGECVSNLADLLGTGLSIMISRQNPSLVKTFAFLSCGYMLSSYQEVRSVVLHTLNRARFDVAVDSFLKTGHVPTLREGNMKESVLSFPWIKERPLVLGPRFKEAFQDAGAYLAIEPLFEREKYMVTYNPNKGKVYALLKEKAKPDDILKAAFHAHVLLHCIKSLKDGSYVPSTTTNLGEQIARSYELASSSYLVFKTKAAEQGWVMSESLLNPGRARLCAPKTEE